MTSKLGCGVALVGLAWLGLACGSSEMTDRLEATYAIADFEIDGAERTRTEYNGSTVVDGPRGITQFFTPLDGVDPDEVFDVALAAAEADGWDQGQSTPRGGVIGYRQVADSESCDVLVVAAPFNGSVAVDVFESGCP